MSHRWAHLFPLTSQSLSRRCYFAELSLEATVLILNFALEEDIPAPRRVLLAVCRRWRDILILDPSCNRLVDFTSVYWTGNVGDIITLRALGRSCRDVVDRFGHSFELRVAVFLTARGWDQCHYFVLALWQELTALCSRIASRTTTLTVRGTSLVLELLFNKDRFWPVLEDLSLHVDDDPYRVLLGCPALRAPLLDHFSSSYITPPLINFLPAHRVTRLDLFSVKLPGVQDTSLDFFLQIIAAFPLLQSLAVALDDIDDPPSALVPAPFLRVLVLSSSRLPRDSGLHTNWRNTSLWGHFVAPSLRMLTVPQRWFTMGASHDLSSFFERNGRVPPAICFTECPRPLADVWRRRHQALWTQSVICGSVLNLHFWLIGGLRFVCFYFYQFLLLCVRLRPQSALNLLRSAHATSALLFAGVALRVILLALRPSLSSLPLLFNHPTLFNAMHPLPHGGFESLALTMRGRSYFTDSSASTLVCSLPGRLWLPILELVNEPASLRDVCHLGRMLLEGAPIDILPSEICVKIFDIAISAQPSDRKALRLVCPRWKALVDSFAACHRHVDFYYISHLSHRHDDDLDNFSRTVRRCRRAVDRAQSALLDLRITVSVGSRWDPATFEVKEIMRELAAFCSVVASRTRSLDIVGTPHIIAPLFDHVWPQLTDMALRTFEDPSPIVRPAMFASPLSRFSTSFATREILSGMPHRALLTTLELFADCSVGSRDEASLDLFLFVLNTFPLLERLRTVLDDVVSDPPSGSISVRHASLRELYFSSPHPSSQLGWDPSAPEWVLNTVWSFFVAPSLTELVVPQRWFVMGAFDELGDFFARSGCQPRLIQFVDCAAHLMEAWQERHSAVWTSSVVQVRQTVGKPAWK
ncbi:hypothetical protein K438DRAFT_1765031 [Mycena galopus ATCC 62051]|nr:hypothetical protein K438DRAFT_1765031 [Mycena galopus ATCC 62051]